MNGELPEEDLPQLGRILLSVVMPEEQQKSSGTIQVVVTFSQALAQLCSPHSLELAKIVAATLVQALLIEGSEKLQRVN